MRSAIAVAAFAFATLSAAQSDPQQNYPYTIDPNSVSDADKAKWCLDQTSQCPLICLQQPGVTSQDTIENECDPEALTYSCVCENNVRPNITEYSQTLPYWICTTWQNQCVANCGLGNNECSNSCRADHPCGAQTPKPANSSLATLHTASSTPSATASSDPWGSTGTSKPNDKGAASSMLNLGQSYSLAVVFAGVFAGFALIL
ncbi:hypothetical protein BU24DRAFT_350530 [Aaosphaeria arxii CBS 175.79]|uniref:DUF7707 domain-containing protein n=1 Tax=Aaosphaeria arxii CBS 175.79 TaxID=1450172 RepID=A0A6A5XJP1_9PLEO|nr:uncharacterized protein BU24DRAFT_350530 [Aaosphaeria arxii CBS 175.79]KAF2013342.1 hypothetical protein BU24DRAFT_350530 [Aaosphaeria arxii CBS 175.79]